ncbi:hypothetical protein GGF41_001350 [Coemansia sp. RSA 2531]|nr:hypothetical protein GGF41_001350 [Coemansia sp. RSA 2531]
MVDDIVRRISHAVERTSRMQVTRHTRTQVVVLAQTFDPSGLVEIRRANTLTNGVPVSTSALQLEFEQSLQNVY